MKIALVKTIDGFKYAHNSDAELAKKIPFNEIVIYDWKKPRNYQFHKKYFALLKLCFDNQEQFKFEHTMREEFTIQAGFYFKDIDFYGCEIRKAKSINFESMDDTEFELLYRATKIVVCEFLKITHQSIVDYIDQYY